MRHSTLSITERAESSSGAAVLVATALAAAFVLAGCAAPGSAPPDPDPSPAEAGVARNEAAPRVIAHRGASGHAPEHTMAAYRLALEMGADYIEQDLQLTRDGTLVVLHDDTLGRTARGPGDRCAGAVRERTLAELRECEVGGWFNEAHPDRARSAYAGQRIPTLRSVLETFGAGARYYIETKSPGSAPGMEEALVDELERADLLPRSPDDRTVLVQSFSEESLRELHELRPSLPLVRLIPDDGRVGSVDSLLARTAEYAVAIGPHRSLVDGTLLEAADRHGLDVHPWTVNDTAEMRRLAELGVDAIFTDFPDRLRRVLGERRR